MFFRIIKKNQIELVKRNKLSKNPWKLTNNLIFKKDKLLNIKKFESIFKYWSLNINNKYKLSNYSILQRYNKWYLYSLFYKRDKILVFNGFRYKRRVRCNIKLKRLKWLNKKFIIAISSHKKSYKHKNFIFYMKVYKELFKNNIKNYKKLHLLFLSFPLFKSFELSRQSLSYISVNSNII